MRVTVSVGGRFHAFDLAAQLHKRGYLCALITSYPAFKAKQWGLPGEKLSTVISNEILSRAFQRLPLDAVTRAKLQYCLAERYDRLAAERIPRGTEIFVGWSGMSLYSLRRAKSLGAKVVIERGSTHIEYQREVLQAEYRTLGVGGGVPSAVVQKELREYEEADCIVVPSSFARRTFLERGVSPEKVFQIPYGVATTSFEPMPKEDNVFRVIHCGAITLRKGVHYLLRAFRELNLPNSELWLIGKVAPEMKPFLAQYGASNVILKGVFPQSQLPSLYAQGSAFCLCSIEEGLALVLLQAIACGLPVICTPNTGGEDLVTEGVNGFIVPARDIEGLKERLKHLHEHPDLREAISLSNRSIDRKNLNWDRYGEAVATRYRELLV
jgi:glycosyltransferase involved in cell wall biosynthesis